MKGLGKVFTFFIIGVVIMGSFYLYLDRIYFAPTTDFTVVNSSGASEKTSEEDFSFVGQGQGKRFYSHDRKYMALVSEDSVKIYTAGRPNDVLNVNLEGNAVSFFEWVNDRNLAIMGLYNKDERQVTLEQFNPESPDHKVDTKIEDLPRNSKITDVVYSTATNVVYMKVKVGDEAYRIYRTDANYDTRRIYVKATNIGRIAVFYDKDKFFYDNLKTGDIFLYTDQKGSWRTINPPGRYLLVGVDKEDNIYVAKVNKDNEALSVEKGQLGVGFQELYVFDSPQKMSSLSVASILKDVANGTNKKSTKKASTDTEKK